MQRLVIVLLVLGLAGAGYFFFMRDDAPGGDDLRPDPPANGTETDGSPTMAAPEKQGPPPKMQKHQLEGAGRLLMIGRRRATVAATFENSFKWIRDLQYRTWYLLGPRPGGGQPPYAGAGRGLAELKSRPSASYLNSQDIQVLVIDEVDPNAFPDSFWEEVAKRVDAGVMGLFFRPGFPLDDAGQALSAHPALSHPILSELLPIAKALEVAGDPLPGTFDARQPLAVTREGVTHPATRLVPDETASRDIWIKAGQGDGKFSTQFVYPVEELKPGAQELIEVEAGASGLPGVVVSGGPARVLWMGIADFGDKRTHFNHEKNNVQLTLLNHWWLWLMGEEPK